MLSNTLGYILSAFSVLSFALFLLSFSGTLSKPLLIFYKHKQAQEPADRRHISEATSFTKKKKTKEKRENETANKEVTS